MEWSPQQDEALKQVAAWLKRGTPQVFRLFGFAGTGKTTLARHFAEGIDGEVAFGAYTGKAAHVLRQKGCADAATIHSLIYRPKAMEDEEAPLFTINRESAASKADLIVIDECSMVDEELGRDLLSFGVRVLVLGDPAQLPPVKGGGFFTEHEPDAMLTEVHRQARDNPIIRLSMEIREGAERLAVGDYGDSRVIRRADIERRMMGLSRACRCTSVSMASGSCSVKKPPPFTGGSCAGSPSTSTGTPKDRRSRPSSSSTIEHSSMTIRSALLAALSRLMVKSGASSSSIALGR